jgi:hypothetical protein
MAPAAISRDSDATMLSRMQFLRDRLIIYLFGDFQLSSII